MIFYNNKKYNLILNDKKFNLVSEINDDTENNPDDGDTVTLKSRNLLDKNNADGTYSNRIEVITGQHYRVYKHDVGSFNTQFKQLDKDGNVIHSYVASEDGVTIADNIKYLQVNLQNSNNINSATIIEGSHCYENYQSYNSSVQCKKSALNGKRWLVLGDSISTGNGVLGGYTYASEPYHYTIAKDKGIIVTNKAVSGYTTQSVYQDQFLNLGGEYTPDLITVFCGVNDVSFSCDTNKWYDLLLTAIKEKFPGAKVGIILPIDYRGSDERLVEKISIIKSLADKHSIKYLDMYQKLEFDFKNPADCLKYTCNDDGLHPNNLGHAFMSKKIDEFIESL